VLEREREREERKKEREGERKEGRKTQALLMYLAFLCPWKQQFWRDTW
jgi:hypothetical protein